MNAELEFSDMTQHVNAIFEHGVLKPLGPVDLHDRDIVSLSIERMPDAAAKTEGSNPSLYELLDEAGLIGCVKDAPADLSTNPS
jgi:predicted DNA-binding antitoxin AbrB/MazE fold protein